MMQWKKTKLIEVHNPYILQRPFHPRTAYRRAEVVKAFGTGTPHSRKVLLHHYFPPEGETEAAPVLLVPGANKDAFFFLDPDEDGRNRSLPEFLRRSGRQVYALTFAHNQDDNWWCCAAINEVLKVLTEEHPDRRFDVLGHSKGGVSVRLAATDWRPDPSCREYLGHRIRRIVLVGAPNLGVDYFFRYPALNPHLLGTSDEPSLNWPVSWSHVRADKGWVNMTELGYTGPCYPGQGQMLWSFLEDYPLPGLHPEERVTYFGGESDSVRAIGLRRTTKECGSLIPEFLKRPPNVSVALIGGSSPTIPLFANDLTGPGDGIVYLKSALHCPDTAKVTSLDAVPVHHKALIAEPEAQGAILQALEATGVLSPEEVRRRRKRLMTQGEEIRLRHSR